MRTLANNRWEKLMIEIGSNLPNLLYADSVCYPFFTFNGNRRVAVYENSRFVVLVLQKKYKDGTYKTHRNVNCRPLIIKDKVETVEQVLFDYKWYTVVQEVIDSNDTIPYLQESYITDCESISNDMNDSISNLKKRLNKLYHLYWTNEPRLCSFKEEIICFIAQKLYPLTVFALSMLKQGKEFNDIAEDIKSVYDREMKNPTALFEVDSKKMKCEGCV